ncbi:MAG: disulfide bond formation protein B [Gammaproteobacteria bacterium]|nr:MAG: disulfide bond formation protein B [Gammaproteobacteria bacterium]
MAMFTPRITFFSMTALTVIGMLFAVLYLEGALNLQACPLCMTQRVFLIAGGTIAFIAALHNSRGIMHRVYAALALLMFGTGAAVAGRHIWLQSLPEDQAPACGPSLEYMLEALPFSETVRLVLMGDGNCADVVWTFMGMSIPMQTLLLFLFMCLLCLWQLLRRVNPA